VATLAALAEWARQAGDSGAAAGDLAWRRASGWREATAALFDPPALRGRLEQVNDVTICHGGSPQRPDRPQAVYLAAWLAGRLGWHVRPATARPERDRLQVELEAGSHVVRLTLAPADGPVVLRLTCGAGGSSEATATVELADPDRIAAAWRSGRGGAWPRSMSLPEAGPAVLLGRELEFSRAEAVYGEALPVAGELARLWQGATAP
jgi:glucose-6-phosphate dehydrogenase assembly protein OpcA